MKSRTFALASLAVVFLAAGAGLLTGNFLHLSQDTRFHAAWKDTFQRPEEMIRAVDAVVVARFTGTSPGRVAFSGDPSDAVPFELNHFVVERGMKGVPAGSTITVERVGGERGGEAIIMDADGGPYEPGQTYVLFLNQQDESSNYYLVNDEGRYSVDGDGRLVPAAEDGAVQAALGGQSVAELASAVGRVMRGR